MEECRDLFMGMLKETLGDRLSAKSIYASLKNAQAQKIQKIAEISGLDTLQYISIEGMKSIYRNDKVNFCDACFSGKYNELF